MRDAAATDPGVLELIREDHRRRRETQRALVGLAIGDARLRPGMTLERAADTFFLLVNSDAYRLATSLLGWSHHQWQRWLVDVITRDCLPDPRA
jgi:hypothetical protein